jgi:hypothetical protein
MTDSMTFAEKSDVTEFMRSKKKQSQIASIITITINEQKQHYIIHKKNF